MLTTSNPRVRAERISRQRSGDTLFLYDATSGRYHELNAVAARIYELCDGSRSVAEIADAVDAPTIEEKEALVFATLAQLDRARLTEAPTPRAKEFSRRRFAATIVVPLVLSAAAPTSAAGPPGSVLDGGVGFDGGFDSGVGPIDGTSGGSVNLGLDATPTGPIDLSGPGPVNPGLDGMPPPFTLDLGVGPQDGGSDGVIRPGFRRF